MTDTLEAIVVILFVVREAQEDLGAVRLEGAEMKQMSDVNSVLVVSLGLVKCHWFGLYLAVVLLLNFWRPLRAAWASMAL